MGVFKVSLLPQPKGFSEAQLRGGELYKYQEGRICEKMKVVKNALELIGNTPLLKLERVTKGLNVNVHVKCGYLNPSGSIKDRMALRMVEEAEKEGKLKPGGTIVESTGGNTGPALAHSMQIKK